MPASTIIVEYSDGTAAKHVGVALGFSSGVTSKYYTNNYGEAVVEHSSVGRATIFVSGNDLGTFHAPGRVAVTLR